MTCGELDELAKVRSDLRHVRDALHQRNAEAAEVYSERAIKVLDRVLGYGAPSGEEVRGG
jgi:plasmid stabilization system protein ParE